MAPMSRYFVPVLFLAATAWLVWQNQQGGQVMVVPFVDVLFPATAGKPALMADRSAQLMAAATGLLFLWSIVEHIQALRRREE
jgi:hypothetical protein